MVGSKYVRFYFCSCGASTGRLGGHWILHADAVNIDDVWYCREHLKLKVRVRTRSHHTPTSYPKHIGFEGISHGHVKL